MLRHLYHVMARGIERRRIFIDQRDYGDFLARLEKIFGSGRTELTFFACGFGIAVGAKLL